MIRLFASYLRERFRLTVFGPAIALHVSSIMWANDTAPTARTVIQSAGLITLMMIQFRLWDDLEDRERDRLQHPERLLVHTETTPFWRVLAALALLNVAWMAASGSRVAMIGLVLLNLTFWFAYRRVRPQISDFIWRFQVLLFKYPAFVVLVAAAWGASRVGRLAAAAVVIYASACVYEALHQRRESTAEGTSTPPRATPARVGDPGGCATRVTS